MCVRCALLIAACARLAAAAPVEPPYMLEQPALLASPMVSESLLGSTWAYLANGANPELRLTITTMPGREVRTRLGAMSDLQCVNLFLAEVSDAHEDFFATAMQRPLEVGGQHFLRFRWSGSKRGLPLTGVLSCGQLDDDYYVIHFVDRLHSATRSFPAIRAALKTLTPR